jgi:exopolysaccharide production protein ExoZ
MFNNRGIAGAGATSSRWVSFTSIYGMPSSRRLLPMEGLRGFAVLLVFFVHLDALFGPYANSAPILQTASGFLGLIGNTGVDLFFVLSGYLIYGALIRHRVTTRHFLIRRVQRIYPTFLAVFVFYLVLSGLFPDSSRLRGYDWPALVLYIGQNLLLLPGMFVITPVITVAWSLSYELFFYISIGAFVSITRMWCWTKAYRIGFMLVVAYGSLGACYVIEHSHVRAVMFVIGMLLFEALSSDSFIRLLSRMGEVVAIAVFAGTLVYCYLLDVHSELFSALPGWWSGRSIVPGVLSYQGPYKTFALSISVFWLCVYCFAYDGMLRHTFSWTPLRYLGNMSYSYYLIHGATLQGFALFIRAFLPQAPGVIVYVSGLIFGFAATWMSATALFLTVEKPTAFGQKITAAGKQPERREANA